MTRKATLQSWAKRLNADVSADASVAQLEAAIEVAISQPSGDEPQYSLRDGFINNARVVRRELPSTAKAIASNLFR